MQTPRFLRDLKRRLKQARHRARMAYIQRFQSFTPADLANLCRELGVESGDVLCVHSSFNEFLGFRGNVKDALLVLQDLVGAEGGILMPTQPFRSSAIEWVRSHPVTDVARAPSLMGLMTEILRRTPGVVRSVNPTHPVAAWGSRGAALVGKDWEAGTPCGRRTAYHRLLEADGKILMLGTGVQPMTFYHCVEELIEPLMPFSPFTDEVFTLKTRDAKGEIHTSHMRLFEPVRSARRRMSLLVPTLEAMGAWRRGRVGRLEVILLRAPEVLAACRAMATEGRYCYLGEGPAHAPQTE